MSLIGAVSLTDKQGVFLGSVNLDNLNIDPNQVVYSTDGINLEGLDLGDGLQKVLNELQTVGNPDIQLTSNSIYCNDNVGSTPVQTAVNLATQSDVIYVSSGSYGEPQVVLTNKYNMAINGPSIGTSTICELLNGINIDNTNELIRISNLAIKTSAGVSSTVIKPIGRTIFHNVVFVGSASAPHIIEIGKETTKYMTFNQVEFDQYCTISISNLLSAPVYFINCNFGGATINFANASPLLVIMSNCSGLVSYPTALQATLVGLNVLTNGASQVNTYDLKTTLINGSSYPPSSSGVSVNNQSVNRVPYCTSTNNTLNCETGYEYDESTNTLSVPNITLTNINGNPPMSATSQAVNRIITATATPNTLHSNQDATWNGTQLSLFNTNHLLIGRGNNSSSDNTNLGVGKNALQSITTATGNTIIGSNSEVLTTQNNNTVVGSSNGANMTGAGTYSGLVLVGYNNTNVANTAGGIAIGSGNTVGTSGIIIGNGSAGGNSSIAIGSTAGGSSTNQFNTSVGGNAGKFLTSGVNNVHFGYGAGSTTTGNYNCMIGSSTGSFANSQSYNVVVGYNSTSGTGGSNTVLGYNSTVGINGYTNCSILGQGVNVIANTNEVQLGNSSTTVYTYATATRVSDMRDKAEIRDTQFGLEFISKLRPRDYKFDYRDDYRELKEIKDEEENVIDYEYIEYPKDGSKKRNRFHCGLIAQEVKEVMDELNTDFAGYIDFNYNKETLNKGEIERLSVKYDELICPLIKAVQELKLKNEQLEERIKVLESK